MIRQNNQSPKEKGGERESQTINQNQKSHHFNSRKPNPRHRTHSGDTSRSPQRPAGPGGSTHKRNDGPKRSFGKQSHHRRPPQASKPSKNHKTIPPLKKGDIRIIPLGGVEEVGKNMTVIEYDDDILIFDAGFQFVTEEDAPGIDYILPNTKYLEERKDKIRGLIITHGHLDHIGGIPYLIEKIGSPTMYCRNLTAIMIQKRMEEFPTVPTLDIKVVEPEEKIRLGKLSVKFFPVTHSIPDSMGASIETPQGNIVITGDLKLEHDEGVPSEKEEEVWGEIGKNKNILFIADSTNVERPGFSIPEKNIYRNIGEIIKNTKGRLIIGTFASQFARMINIIETAEKHNKKIITEGRSIKTNIEIARIAGIYKPKEGTIIPVDQIDNYSPDRIVVIATGAQGEEFAALMRMANKTHKYIKLNKRDTVVLSSSVIPGNEISVQKLKDNLYRHDLKIIHYRVSDVHSTGHGNAGELAWINKKVGAKYFMPAYGFHSMLKVHAEVARSIGMLDKDIIVPDNGTVIEIRDNGEKLVTLKELAPSNPIMVDGFSIGDQQEVVLRDRQMLAQDGMFVVIASIDVKTGKVKKSPDIISRGFVYLRESQDLLKEARVIIKKTIETNASGMHPINFEYIKNNLSDNISRFLFQKTNKKPIVIPVILGV